VFLSKPDVILLVAYVLIALSLVPLGLTITYLRKSRRGSYYGLRRDALRKAQYWGLGTALLWLVSLVLLVLHPLAEPIVSVDLRLTPTLTATQIPTRTSVPTETPSPTPTRRATATPPFIPTFTPEILPPEPAMSLLPSAVPADPDARIVIMAVSTQKDENDVPVEPATEFAQGRHPLYVFFEYGGMENGNVATFAWYKDGEHLETCSETWVWGLPEDRKWGERGGAFLMCDPSSGWQAGNYEVRVFIDTWLQSVVQFVIVP